MFTGLVETVGTLCGRGAERLRIRPAKKLEALAHFLKKKDTSVEAELGYALTRLYEKTVPPTVREFLEDTGSDGDSPQNF